MFRPRAANGVVPSCPTKAVSMRETSGSAANAPKAGKASPNISQSEVEKVGIVGYLYAVSKD